MTELKNEVDKASYDVLKNFNPEFVEAVEGLKKEGKTMRVVKSVSLKLFKEAGHSSLTKLVVENAIHYIYERSP